MSRWFRRAAALSALALAWGGHAAAATRSEAWCEKPGLARPVRQTVVVIDEAHFVANPAGGGLAPQNKPWTRFVGELVDPAKIDRAGTFAPRERLTVLVARRDGSEPRLVFTGCLPFYSQAEKARLARQAGGLGSAVNTFFGSGPVQAAAKDMGRFRAQLAAALADAARPEAMSPPGKEAINKPFTSSGLFASLRHGPLADLALGTPRIVFYANFSRFTPPGRNLTEARRAGFALARSRPADLRRAEVYVAGVAPSQTERGRAFIETWMLGSGGLVRSWTHSGLGAVDPYPTRVEVFSGVVRYGDVEMPTRLRLATAPDGRVVASWIAVQGDVETATPFFGEVVDLGGGSRRVRSDGKGLGQLWSADADEEPEFSAGLPFAGLRRLEFTIDDSGVLKGRISDPLVNQIRGSKTPYLSFRLTRTKTLF